jgi:tetratricopeptide (TPR) repeat protein
MIPTGFHRRPPFSSQPANSQRMERLQVRARQLHARMDQQDAVAAGDNFRQQLARSPDDFQLRENFALFLQDRGDLTQSLAEWRRVHDLIPHDFLPYLRLGEMLSRQGQGSEAETNLQMALKIRPSLTEGWIELGNLHASQGKPAEALDDYSAAWQQNPQNAQTAFHLAKVHAMLNQHAEAVEFYRQAIKLNPVSWEPHYELGGELDSAGQLEESKNEFAEAARLNPDNSRVHYNYGVLLAKQDQLDEAQREFTEANRLDPGYQNAQDALLKIQQLKRLAPKK